MNFISTPEESQPLAKKLLRIYKSKRYKVDIEKALSRDAPYRTTLISRDNYNFLLIEVQSRLNYHLALKGLAHWIAKNRTNCELYIALDSSSALFGVQLTRIMKDGVGILILDEEENIEIIKQAKNFSLIVTPDPTLVFKKYSKQIKESIDKFNNVNRKDGLRDLCEIFESAIEDLGIKLCKKNKFVSLTEAGFKSKELNDKINLLAVNEAFNSNKAIIDDTLKTDLHSFRNARNLCDHKTRTKGEEYRRRIQFPDKMMLGCRVIYELEKITQKIR